jgi:16S rRNA (cytosine967-C5)-methyltransferase
VAYVTCSPHLTETVGVLAAVTRRRGASAGTGQGAEQAEPVVERLDARPFLPGVPDLGAGPTVQLWPHRHGTDAMFLALLRRMA